MEAIEVEILDAEPAEDETTRQRAAKLASILESKLRIVSKQAKRLRNRNQPERLAFAAGMAVSLGIAARLMYALAAGENKLIDEILEDEGNPLADNG